MASSGNVNPSLIITSCSLFYKITRISPLKVPQLWGTIQEDFSVLLIRKKLVQFNHELND